MPLVSKEILQQSIKTHVFSLCRRLLPLLKLAVEVGIFLGRNSTLFDTDGMAVLCMSQTLDSLRKRLGVNCGVLSGLRLRGNLNGSAVRMAWVVTLLRAQKKPRIC